MVEILVRGGDAETAVPAGSVRVVRDRSGAIRALDRQLPRAGRPDQQRRGPARTRPRDP